MKRLLAALVVALSPIVSASADPPAARSIDQAQPADIVGYAATRWGSPIFAMPHPVLMIPPKSLPVGLAEAKLPELGIHASPNKFIWLLVSNGDGMLSSLVTFLDDREFDGAYRAVVEKLGRGTMGSLSLATSGEARCMFWQAEDYAITMHFTATVGTVLILTPGQVAACAPGGPKTAEKTAAEQGV